MWWPGRVRMAPEQHDMGGGGGGRFEGPHPVVGIFVEVAQAGVDHRASPGFQSVEAHGVENPSGGQDLGGGLAGGSQRLVPIP